MEEAAEDVVLFIDDDCTVHESWAGTGRRLPVAARRLLLLVQGVARQLFRR
jgi:hypothetical protein